MTEDTMPEEIYLLLDAGDEGGHLWCDHIPDNEMEVVNYIKAGPDKLVISRAWLEGLRHTDCNINEDYRALDRGWNACLDKILGGQNA